MGELDDTVSRDVGDTADAAIGNTVVCNDDVEHVDIEQVDAYVEGVDKIDALPNAALLLFGVDAVS